MLLVIAICIILSIAKMLIGFLVQVAKYRQLSEQHYENPNFMLPDFYIFICSFYVKLLIHRKCYIDISVTFSILILLHKIYLIYCFE